MSPDTNSNRKCWKCVCVNVSDILCISDNFVSNEKEKNDKKKNDKELRCTNQCMDVFPSSTGWCEDWSGSCGSVCNIQYSAYRWTVKWTVLQELFQTFLWTLMAFSLLWNVDTVHHNRLHSSWLQPLCSERANCWIFKASFQVYRGPMFKDRFWKTDFSFLGCLEGTYFGLFDTFSCVLLWMTLTCVVSFDHLSSFTFTDIHIYIYIF